jgi:hypothetical protein
MKFLGLIVTKGAKSSTKSRSLYILLKILCVFVNLLNDCTRILSYQIILNPIKMKQITVLILVIFSTIHAQSQLKAVKVEPLFSLRYEHQLSKKISGQVGGTLTIFPLLITTVTITGISGGARIYQKEAMRGLYVHPIVSFTKVKTDNYDNSTELNKYFSLGCLIGHQWVASSGFTFDIGVGIANGMKIGADDNNDNEKTYLKGIHPKFTLGLGHTWGLEKKNSNGKKLKPIF